MIATWMLYAALVSALLTVAAIAANRVVHAAGLPSRFVWVASIALSIVWPAAAALQPLSSSKGASVRVMPFAIAVQPVQVIAPGGVTPDRAALVDRGLVALWVILSALLLVRLVQAVVVIGRRRREWRSQRIDGMSVCISENVGPAVVGLRSMDVVVPEWITTLDASLRAIVLRHEEEHRVARDPHLLFMSTMAVALMPWNIALWIQARRLRLAVEMDCDARVLRAHPSTERYGLLMLTIAQRRSIAPPIFAPMLSEPSSQLERRILAMQPSTRRLARLTIAGGTVVAASALLFACALQSENPTQPRPLTSRTVEYNPNTTYFEFQVTKQVSLKAGSPMVRYPDLLREGKIEGTVLAQFVVDAQGRPDMSQFKVLKSDHDLFTAAVRNAIPLMQFTPAELKGHTVKQLVQMPFQFNLSHGNTVESKAPRSGTAALSNARGPKFVTDSQTFFEYQVEQAATAQTGTLVAPKYPAELRAANISGEVLAQFVVDTTGAPVMESFKVLKSSHDLFTNAVRQALPDMRFRPAQVGGKAVKQVVQMPFQFSLSK
jgi:TonB family protein